MSRSKEKLAYRWLMKQARPARNWLAASMILGVVSGMMLLGQAALLADIIHSMVMEEVSRGSLVNQFLLTALLMILRGVCHWGREICGFNAGAQVRQTVRKALLDKLRILGPLVIAERPAGSWSSVVVDQVEELQEFVAHYLPQMVLAAAIPLLMLLVVFPSNWIVGLIFLMTAPLIPMFMMFVGLKAAEANRKNFQALSRLGGFFLDRLQGLETLRLFQRTEFAASQLEGASEDFRIKTMKVLRLAFLSSTILEFFASISIALVAVYLGMNFLGHIEAGGNVSLYTGLFLLLLAPEFYQPLRELGTYYHAKAKAVGATESILDILDRDAVEAHSGNKELPEGAALDIRVQDLTVTTPQARKPLLDQLNFSIKAGQRVAVIGSSGAGKSTLINTLMGFWRFEGEVQWSGQSMMETRLSSWRRQMAWLGQHPLIVHGSVFDNIAFGRDLSEQQALDALERANGLDILDTLPSGLGSLLKEQGGNLSVGQAQRIALARAIATPVKLLILDEPTASLDSGSEQQVINALNALPEDCTVITITHRLSQLDAMDQILLLDNGRLIANGSPEELRTQSSEYEHFISGQGRSMDDA
ncbi:thiol reductant ABC exporter subunit CydD [Endozoicomonas sp. (ex Bugula neritina AB1)]|nr:thiol reductant ABC exporter subunit CydD [Endozoicomonas sp. (ex Bugula neritina AB1)]